jgi:hypothetical protein
MFHQNSLTYKPFVPGIGRGARNDTIDTNDCFSPIYNDPPQQNSMIFAELKNKGTLFADIVNESKDVNIPDMISIPSKKTLTITSSNNKAQLVRKRKRESEASELSAKYAKESEALVAARERRMKELMEAK